MQGLHRIIILPTHKHLVKSYSFNSSKYFLVNQFLQSVPTCQSALAQLLCTLGQTAFSTNCKERCQKSPQSLTSQKPKKHSFCSVPFWSLMYYTHLTFFEIFFERKTWQIQFSLEAYNEKAKTVFKKRTGTSTRSTPLEKTPKSSENHGLFQEQCYSSPIPR